MNAREEFLREIGDRINRVKCAYITLYGCDIDTNTGKGLGSPRKKIVLREGWNKQDLDKFLDYLDIDYYDGYGGQELFGYIWMDDGTWFERHEYDGAECWEYKKYPEIPAECQS